MNIRTDRGETPILVSVSILIFALFALASGPVIHAVSKANVDTSVERRLDKALSINLDSERRQGWFDLQPAGPETTELDFEDYTLPLTTWVEEVTDLELRVTKAVPVPLSEADCTAPTPENLPEGCIARSAKVAATNTEYKPVTSPEVTLANNDFANSSFRNLNAGAKLFDIAVTKPMKVSLIYRTTSPNPTFHVNYSSVTRAQILTNRTPGTPEDNQWRFGNAIVCPNWATGSTTGATMQVVSQPGGGALQLADVLVITTPVAASECN